MEQARKIALRDFSSAARKYSDRPSKSRGGLEGPYRIDELLQEGREFAGLVMSTKPGTLSRLVKIGSAYYIVKTVNTKSFSLEEVYGHIRAHLYQENEQAAFAQWIQEQRKRINVTVFLNNYTEI